MSAVPSFITDKTEFAKPWHGGLFALTLACYEAGCFTWPEFSEALGAALAARTNAHHLIGEVVTSQDMTDEDTEDQYYSCWFEALTSLLASQNFVTSRQLDEMKTQLEQAYLSTPHGQPVIVKSTSSP